MKTICCNRPKYALYKIDVFGSFEVAKRRTTEAEKNQIITKIGVTTKNSERSVTKAEQSIHAVLVKP